MALLQDENAPNGVSTLTFPLSENQPQVISDDLFRQHLKDSLFPQYLLSNSDYRENRDLASLFTAELGTPVLDEMKDYLHFVATRSLYHVDPLHEQHIKKRNIVITENPGLHLVWYYDTIFIKPIPPILLNFTIWREFLLPPTSIKNNNQQKGESTPSQRKSYRINSLNNHCKSALGFLRTYALLVRYPSDFRIAQNLYLIPSDINYSEFRAFINPFMSLPHSAVSHRYEFGQMRLTRLNWAVRLLQPRSVSTGSWFANRLYYQELYTQSGDYLVSWLPPLLFAFTSLSLMLSSMQVVLAALGTGTWRAFVKASWGFSVATIILCSSVTCIMSLHFLVLVLGQVIYSLRDKSGRVSETRRTRYHVTV
jgi:hypothetical protein